MNYDTSNDVFIPELMQNKYFVINYTRFHKLFVQIGIIILQRG